MFVFFIVDYGTYKILKNFIFVKKIWLKYIFFLTYIMRQERNQLISKIVKGMTRLKPNNLNILFEKKLKPIN